MAERPEIPGPLLHRFRAVLDELPRCREEEAWIGVRWRVGQHTVAHLFGGEDGLFRATFRAEPDEVLAFEHLGSPYFRTDWGGNVVGMIITDRTDWQELTELLTDSYCIQAPAHLAEQLARPSAGRSA
jgi:hypothetical protein